MEDTHNGVRIRTNVASDKVLNVNLTRDIDFLEVLSLKLNTRHEYKLMTSKTGVVIGRVLANGGFGIPNAKVSIFIPVTDEDYQDSTLRSIYPYKTPQSKNSDGIRYNLLPDSSADACYQVIGNFPNKRLVLDDGLILEAYDKYYRLTTVTNASGDFMLYGVPTGSQKLHVDIDLSDIGVLSQRPIDLIYKGANINQFESPKIFKKDTNLDGLTQVYSQNEAVDVYPFWGDENTGIIAVTRCDIKIDYKFEPTCVFMGSTFTDSGKNSFSHRCKPAADMGKNSQLIAREGNIEMIRKTKEGGVESYAIHGTELINGDGVFCYQIPMNLDYVTTDEFGNTVASDDINRGIPTRTSVRFRFTLTDTDNEGASVYRAKYLVPNNPDIVPNANGLTTHNPNADAAGRTWDSYYKFGSETREEDFKDLYWNQVYSVKNYIPRLQKGAFASTSKKYSGIKAVNYSGQNNPVPFNKIRIKLNFSYILLCVLGKIIITAVGLINLILSIYNHAMLTMAGWFRSIGDDLITHTAVVRWLAKYFNRLALVVGGSSYIDFSHRHKHDGNDAYCSGVDATRAANNLYGVIYHNGCITIDFMEDSDIFQNRFIIPRCMPFVYDNAQNMTIHSDSDDTYNTQNSGSTVTISDDDTDNSFGVNFNSTTCPPYTDSPVTNHTYLFENRKVGSYPLSDFPASAITSLYSQFWSKKYDLILDSGTAYEELFNELERMLADEYEIVSLDFYNDWLNGALYFPLWYRKKTRKKNLFGLFTIPSKERYCQCLGPNREGNGVDENRRGSNSRNWRYYTRFGAYGEIPLTKDGKANTKTLQDWANGTTYGNGEKSRYLRQKNAMRFKNGIIHNTKNWDQLNLYYYANGASTLNSWKTDGTGRELGTFIPLFGTDIITLGSLNECDVNGIPQFFKRLTSTTANIPPVGSEYQENDDTSDTAASTFGVADSTINRNIIEINGMDFNKSGSTTDKFFTWHNGLFMNLKCMRFHTIPKTVINAERLSEFGMYVDGLLSSEDDDQETTGVVPITTTTPLDDRPKYADGLVSTFEIFDPDGRSMFATLNGNTTKVVSPFTGYNIDKMPYTYLYGFNGLLGAGQTDTIATFQNATDYHDIDILDVEYVKFKYGDEKRFVCANINSGNKTYYLSPYYNNSFYFYLGLSEGKSAIDVFNKEFYGSCPETELEVTERRSTSQIINRFDGTVWEQYGGSFGRDLVVGGLDISAQLGRGDTIQVMDLATNELVMSGEAIKPTNNITLTNTFSSSILTNDLKQEAEAITPGTYRVQVRRSNGRVVEDEVTIHDTTVYTIDTHTEDLQESYISDGLTPVSQFTLNKTYGKVILSSVSVNGVVYAINNAVTNRVKKDDDEKLQMAPNEVILFLENGLIYLFKIDNGNGDFSFMCENAHNSGAYLTFENGQVILYGYKPTKVNAYLYRVKDVDVNLSYVISTEDEPVVTNEMSIQNGYTYQAFLNSVPVPFISDYAICSHNVVDMKHVVVNSADTKTGVTYEITAATTAGIWGEEPIAGPSDITRWTNVEDPANGWFYNFPKVYGEGAAHRYSDFVKFDENTMTSGLLEGDAKMQALAYRLRCAFNMAASTYYTGGKIASKLILATREESDTVSYATASPYYLGFSKWYYTNILGDETEKKDPKNKYHRKFNTFNYSTRNEIRLANNQPTIVGKNFCYKEDRDQFNHLWTRTNEAVISSGDYMVNPIYGEYIQNASADTLADQVLTIGNYFGASVTNASKTKVSYPSRLKSYDLGTMELTQPIDDTLYKISVKPTYKSSVKNSATAWTITSLEIQTNPLLRTQFVDKRIDYDFDVTIPARNSGDEICFDNITLYNGVKMAYSDYTVPSAVCYDVSAYEINNGGQTITPIATVRMYEAEGDKFLYANNIPVGTKSVVFKSESKRTKAIDIEKGMNMYTINSIASDHTATGKWSLVEAPYKYYDQDVKMLYLDANNKLGLDRGRKLVGDWLEYIVDDVIVQKKDKNTGAVIDETVYEDSTIKLNKQSANYAKFYKFVVMSDGYCTDLTSIGDFEGKEFKFDIDDTWLPARATKANRHTVIIKGCSYDNAAYVENGTVQAIAKYDLGVNVPIPVDGWFNYNDFVLNVTGSTSNGIRTFRYNEISRLSFPLAANYLNEGQWQEYFKLPDPEITIDGVSRDMDNLFKVVMPKSGRLVEFNGEKVTATTAPNRSYYNITAEECKNYTCGYFEMTTGGTVEVDTDGNAKYHPITLSGSTATLQFINRRLFLNNLNNGLNNRYSLNVSSDIYKVGDVNISAKVIDRKVEELYYETELKFTFNSNNNNLFDHFKADDVTMTIYKAGASLGETIYIHERHRVTVNTEADGTRTITLLYGTTMYEALEPSQTYLVKLEHKSQYGPDTVFDEIPLQWTLD